MNHAYITRNVEEIMRALEQGYYDHLRVHDHVNPFAKLDPCFMPWETGWNKATIEICN
jgi:hypothetical protein